MEIWKDIKGYEGYYQVSNLGRVKSLERTVIHKNQYSNFKYVKKEKIMKQVFNKHNYLIVCLKKNKKQKTFLIHRLVAESFIFNIDKKRCVNHIDGIKSNNNVENLEWVTYSENMQHAYDIGLINKIGENNGSNYLTEKDIRNIRNLKKFYTYKELSTIFDIPYQTIYGIIKRKTWKHI